MDTTQALALFQRLIQVPSVTATPAEDAACALLESVLDEYGVAHERVCETPDRPNLLARLPASAPCGEPPLVLISHIDVAGGDETQWKFPMFGGEIREGRVCGRGTLDTKHLTIMELMAFTALVGRPLCRDVVFVATVDEEAGSEHGMAAVKRLRPALFQNAEVINEGGGFPVFVQGKPYLTVTMGEKSIFRVRVSAKGAGGHASAPTGDQAVVKLAAALEKLFAKPCLLESGSRRIADAIERLSGGQPLEGAAANLYDYARGTSLSMRGWQLGERVNVLPASTECVVEIKTRPHTEPDEVKGWLSERLAGTQAEWELLSFEDGFESDPDAPLLGLLAEGAKRAGHPLPLFPMLALGRTDGRFFGPEGSAVFGCSPCLEQDSFDRVLTMVHGPNESIAEASFRFGCDTLTYAIATHCIKEV